MTLNICELKLSYFYDCHSLNSGGVMNITNENVNVICCFFTNNSCAQHGGCLYTQNCPTNVLKSIFIGCYSTAQNQNFRGNAMNMNGNSYNHYIENCVTYKCGPEPELSSDTAIFSTGITKLLLYNASNNYGVEGASGINLNIDDRNGPPHPTAKFVTISTGYDKRFYEQTRSDITLEHFNFINSTQNNDWIININTCNLKAVSCIFYQMNIAIKGLGNFNNMYCVEYVDCSIDSTLSNTISGIKTDPDIKTLTYSPNIECIVTIVTNSNNKFIYIIQTVFIHNSIFVIG